MFISVFALFAVGCASAPRKDPARRTLERFARFARLRSRADLQGLLSLFTPRCRMHCRGFSGRAISGAGSTQSGGYWLARWVPRFQRGTLLRYHRNPVGMGDLLLALASYETLQKVSLAPLRSLRLPSRRLVRARLVLRGRDRSGLLRQEDGICDLTLRRRGASWYIDDFSAVFVHTLRRRDPAYVMRGRVSLQTAGRPARDGAAAAAAEKTHDQLLADLDGDGRLDRYQLRRGRPDVLSFGGRVNDAVISKAGRARDWEMSWRSEGGCVLGQGNALPAIALLSGRKIIVARLQRKARGGKGPRFVVERRLELPRGLFGARCQSGDLDGDLRADLVIATRTQNIASKQGRTLLWLSSDPQRLRPLYDATFSRRLLLFDHDNDGDLDLMVGRTRRAALWINIGRGTFVRGDHTAQSPRELPHRIVDIDGDGALDLVAPSGRVALWRGGQGELGELGAKHGVVVRARYSRANPYGIGTRVVARFAGGAVMRVLGLATGMVGDPAGGAHIGVGAALRIRQLDIRWPDGSRERHHDLPVRRLITISPGKAPRWQPFEAANSDSSAAPTARAIAKAVRKAPAKPARATLSERLAKLRIFGDGSGILLYGKLSQQDCIATNRLARRHGLSVAQGGVEVAHRCPGIAGVERPVRVSNALYPLVVWIEKGRVKVLWAATKPDHALRELKRHLP
jgi:hypothetical protein